MRRLLLVLLALVPMQLFAQSEPPIGSVISSVTHYNSTVGVSAPGEVTVVTVADSSGSLNNKYFTINDGNNTHKYYVWLNVSSGGTDPLVAGLTGVEVDIATNDTNATVATAIGTALAALSSSFASAGVTGHTVDVVNAVKGATSAPVDHATGFTITQTVVGGGQLAIPSASVIGGLLGYKICNNGVQTSTWLAVGQHTDPEADGERVGKGICYECMSCTASSLKKMYVSGQASSAGYSVIQFKQQ